jgi:hypothetical protein
MSPARMIAWVIGYSRAINSSISLLVIRYHRAPDADRRGWLLHLPRGPSHNRRRRDGSRCYMTATCRLGGAATHHGETVTPAASGVDHSVVPAPCSMVCDGDCDSAGGRSRADAAPGVQPYGSGTVCGVGVLDHVGHGLAHRKGEVLSVIGWPVQQEEPLGDRCAHGSQGARLCRQHAHQHFARKVRFPAPASHRASLRCPPGPLIPYGGSPHRVPRRWVHTLARQVSEGRNQTRLASPSARRWQG